jgi:hypothetical protein
VRGRRPQCRAAECEMARLISGVVRAGPQFVDRSSWSSSARLRSSRSASDSSCRSGHLLRLIGLSPLSGLVDHLPGPTGAKTAAGWRTSSAGREWLREKGHADACTAGRRRPVIADEPAMADIGTAVCIISTVAPEADGALAGNETTLAPVAVRAGSQPGIGWTCAAVAVGVADLLSCAVVGRGRRRPALDRALDPQGGDAQ